VEHLFQGTGNNVPIK